MKPLTGALIGVTLSLSIAACGGKAKGRLAIEIATPGRDRELFSSAITDILGGHGDAARLELNTILNAYSDSPLSKAAKLALADSFYLDGGAKNLAQAEAGYIEFLQFFPPDPLNDQVRLKIVDIHLRQISTEDRAIPHAQAAERELKDLIRDHPDSPVRKEADARLTEIQELLAGHELKVARFYYDLRQAPAATQRRTEYILNNYPNFSRLDQVLYYHARSMADQEDTQTAGQDLSRLVRQYPESDYHDKAVRLLRKINLPVSDPESNAAATGRHRAGMLPRLFGTVFGLKLQSVSSQGVLVDRTLKAAEILLRAEQSCRPNSK